MKTDVLVPPAPAVVYVGGAAADRAAVEQALDQAGVGLLCVDTKGDALEALSRQQLGVCLIDLAPNGQALRTARALATRCPTAVLIGLADPARPETTADALRAGLADVVPRPLGSHDVEAILAIVVQRLTRNGLVARQPEARARGLTLELVGHSAPLRRLLDDLQRAAQSRASVLIAAEPGLDCEGLAREIHARGPRATGPFVTVRCGGDDPSEIERRLFGTTGVPADLEAVGPRSQLAAARGGTLFLQDVHELPAPTQARLARLVRDGQVAIDGDATRPVTLDARVIASAGPEIDAEVAEGRLRADLYRRLAVMRVDVPPLRHRADDVPMLARYLAVELSAASGAPARSFTQAALTLLAALPWPGNVAELRRVLQRVIASVAEPVIRLEDLLAHVKLDGSVTVAPPRGTLREARLRFEREYIAAVLQHHGWRMSDAARALGIQRANLYRKARQLRIPRIGRTEME